MNSWGRQPIRIKNDPFRVGIIFDGITGGGAGRVATILGNAWAAKDLDVALLTTDDGSATSAYQVHKRVKLVSMGLARDSHSPFEAIINNCARIRRVRTAIRRLEPDVIISFLDRINVLTLLATRGLGVPIVVSERTDPAGLSPGRAWELLRHLTYPWADALVCQGEKPLGYFGKRIRKRGCIIPNPVVLPAETCSLPANLTGPKQVRTLAAMGRLGPEKGFDVFLNAFSQVAPRHPQWHLVIWGEGASRPELEAQARKLGIGERVTLPGATQEPFARLADADLFVLSSRVEGFPMALCEAMAVGLPVIATDVGAVSDIVRKGVDGMLIPPNDIDALAAAMEKLMSAPEDRQRLASRAPEVLERYSLKKVLSLWEDLIRDVTSRINL